VSAIYDELAAARPVLEADAPFRDVLEAFSDGILALTKVLDLVELDPVAFHEEFTARSEDEQTQFGIQITVGVLTVKAAAQSIAGAVADAFAGYNAVTTPAVAEDVVEAA
jgi:hypothetical protein